MRGLHPGSRWFCVAAAISLRSFAVATRVSGTLPPALPTTSASMFAATTTSLPTIWSTFTMIGLTPSVNSATWPLPPPPSTFTDVTFEKSVFLTVRRRIIRRALLDCCTVWTSSWASSCCPASLRGL